MAYVINKADGTVLTTLIDGTTDTTTDLTLIGKNYSGFGLAINQDLVKLLENFANATPPSKPITGQLWYDKFENRLKVYDGAWKAAGGTIVQGYEPLSFTTGDLWVDSEENQLWFFDGSDLTLAGPNWKKSQGKTGTIAETVFDIKGNERHILNLYVNDTRMGIFSSELFTPKDPITGFTSLLKGFNKNSQVDFLFNATMTNSQTLQNLSAAQFMRSDTSTGTTGALSVQNDSGITLGSNQAATLYLSSSNLVVQNSVRNANISLKISKTAGTEDAIFIDGTRDRVGIFTGFPTATLDVNGDVSISGNLTVIGASTTINTTSMTIEDKNIEIGAVTALANISGTITGSGTTTTVTGIVSTAQMIPGQVLYQASGTGTMGNNPKIYTVDSLTQITIVSDTANFAGTAIFSVGGATNVTADGAGITIKGTTDKTITYNNTSVAFDISENINLAAGKVLRIGNVDVISSTALSASITSASGITRVGNLDFLLSGDISVADSTNTNRISTTKTNQDLELDPNGTGNVALIGSPKITGLGAPTSSQDATTKTYVDTNIKQVPLSITFVDNSGISVNAKIVSLLTDIATPANFVDGKEAYVHVQRIDFVAQTITRSLKKFVIASGAWIFTSDLASSI